LRRLQQNRPDGNLIFFDPVEEETRLLARFRFLNQPVRDFDRHDPYVFPLPGRFEKADDLFDGNLPLFDFPGNHDPPARDGKRLLNPEAKTAHRLSPSCRRCRTIAAGGSANHAHFSQTVNLLLRKSQFPQNFLGVFADLRRRHPNFPGGLGKF
jgi:hypothetical protein